MKKIVMVSLAAALSLSLAGCKHNLDETEQLRAKTGARDAADRMQAELISCSGQDSDGDGYVSCKVQPRKGGPSETLQCAYSTMGCK